MGQRLIAPHATLAGFAANPMAYTAHRIEQGVPEGGIDFAYGDSFVQDANLDQTEGVDFKKGCYVGQEVVARVHFRRSARKRIVKLRGEAALPATGTPVMAGDTPLGTIGSVAGRDGLAMLRLDKLEDARGEGMRVTAGGVALEVSVPAAFLEGAALAKAVS
jgi:folate-binding protein YgfZ